MNAIRIRKRIRSATLRLPELTRMIGKDVEIIVLEEPPPPGAPGRLKAFFDAAGKINLDPRALGKLRKASLI